MDRLQALEGIRRISSSIPGAASTLSDTSKEAYLQEIMRHFGTLSLEDWDSVVSWIVKNRKARSLPSIADLDVAVKAVRAGSYSQSENSCKICRGTHFLMIQCKRLLTGEVLDFASPCQVCNSGLTERIPEGFVKVY